MGKDCLGLQALCRCLRQVSQLTAVQLRVSITPPTRQGRQEADCRCGGGGGDLDCDRRETAAVQWDVAAHKAAQRIDGGRVRDGAGCIGVAEHLRPGALKVKYRGAVAAVNRDGQPNLCPIVHEVAAAHGAHLWEALRTQSPGL